jgi:transposase
MTCARCLDAIGYLTRYGIEWRALPIDFPPWTAVYAFFERWSERGLPQRLTDRLRERIRIACGRTELPTAAVIDAQTVRGSDTVAAASAGYDAGKKYQRVQEKHRHRLSRAAADGDRHRRQRAGPRRRTPTAGAAA